MPPSAARQVGSAAALFAVGSIDCDTTPDGVSKRRQGSEWIADWYGCDAPTKLPSRNPLAEVPTWDHVVRGGAWLFPYDRPGDPPDLTTSTAGNASHVDAGARIGFRCAFDIGP